MTYFSTPKQSRTPGANNFVFYNNIIILAIVLILALFLVEYNGLVKENYELGRFQALISSQQSLSQKLATQLIEKQSVVNLQEAAKNLNLVAIDKVKYLKSSQGSMALASQTSR